MQKILTRLLLWRKGISLPSRAYDYLAKNPGYSEKYFLGRRLPVLFYFIKRMQKDWRMIKPFFTANDLQVAEIGSGMGALALYYLRDCSSRRVHLIDRENRQHDGISSPLQEIARNFLRENGCADLVATVDSDSPDLETRYFPVFDLVISLRALAYQFPLQKYNWLLVKNLKPQGILITDISRASPTFVQDWSTLQALGSVTLIYETRDKMRVAVKKNKIELVKN